MTWQVIVVSTARTWQVIVRVPVGVKSSVRIVEIILPWYLVKTTSKRRVMTHKSLLNNSKHITEAYLNLSANAWEKYGKPTKLSSRGEQTHRTCFPSLLEPRKDQYRLCTKGFVVFSSLRYYSGHRQFPDLAAIPTSSYIIHILKTCVCVGSERCSKAAASQACGLCVGRAGGSERDPVLRSMRGTWSLLLY